MITIHTDDCSSFQLAPRDQGQIIEYAYATTEGGYVRRTTDRSDGSVMYEYAACNDYAGSSHVAGRGAVMTRRVRVGPKHVNWWTCLVCGWRMNAPPSTTCVSCGRPKGSPAHY